MICLALVGATLAWACQQPPDRDRGEHGENRDHATETLYAAGQEPEQRLEDLGIELYETVQPVANYVTAVRSGNQIWLAGHGPIKPE